MRPSVCVNSIGQVRELKEAVDCRQVCKVAMQLLRVADNIHAAFNDGLIGQELDQALR